MRCSRYPFLYFLILTLLMVSGVSSLFAVRKKEETKKSYYQIKEGDNLVDVARKLGVPYSTFAQHNGVSLNGGKPNVGTVLIYKKDEVKPRVVFLGRLHNGVQLSPGKGYKIRDKNRSWGTQYTIDIIKQVFGKMHKIHPELNPILICDISRQYGGIMGGHITHQQGFDYDVLIYRKGNPQYEKMIKATPETIDPKPCIDMLSLQAETKRVKFILLDYGLQKVLYDYASEEGWSKEKLRRIFQYPRGQKAKGSIMRHRVGHADHFHIRYSPTEVPDSLFTGTSTEEYDDEDLNDEGEDEEETEDQVKKQAIEKIKPQSLPSIEPFLSDNFVKDLFSYIKKEIILHS